MKKTIVRTKLTFIIAFFMIAVGLSGQVSAQGTPDSITPANEGICDQLVGSTPGLYGLCVAYCEAQDLDLYVKNPPATKILNNYRKKMAQGDPDMPCVQSESACPCWTEDELNSIAGSRGPVFCKNFPDWSSIFESDGIAEQSAAAGQSEVGLICNYVDETADPAIVRYMEPTPEEALLCATQIDQRCAELGL